MATRHSAFNAFNLFKDKVYELSQALSDSEYTLQRSFGLNSTLTQLLQTSRSELAGLNRSTAGSNADNIDSSAQLPPNPFEILTVMCEYGLARDSHFQVVLEYLVAANAPQDVLGLWIKYLETIAENPKTITYGSHHANNIALASIGYLMLPGNAPNLSELAQILNIADKQDQMPLSRIRYLADTLKMDQATRQNLLKKFGILFSEFAHVCKPEFQKQLQAIEQVQDLQRLYQTLTSASKNADQKLDSDTIALFMLKFTQLKKPQQAINCFNIAKQQDQLDESVNNALLVAVANIPVYGKDVREQKATRIEAVWNSYIASSPDGISANSYAALITALGESRNYQKMQQLWKNEIPSELKKDQLLAETHLLFQCYRKETTLEGIKNQIPSKINSIDLANELLFKMAQEKAPESEIEEFYREQFLDTSAHLKPNYRTLALKMYINHQYSEDPDFVFMKSISKSKNDINTTNGIFKQFTEFCPDIEITRKLFEEIRIPLDSRKFGYMISAESKAGNLEACEEIFKSFAQETKRINTLTKAILDPVIEAVCEEAIREKSTAMLERMCVYATFAKKAQKYLTFQSASKIVHTLAILSKAKEGKFSPQQEEYLDKLLHDVKNVRNFTPPKRDLDILLQNKVKLPKGME